MQLRHDEKINLLVETVRKFLRRKAYFNLQKLLSKTHAADIAKIIDVLHEEHARKSVIAAISSPKIAASVLSEIGRPQIIALVHDMEVKKACAIFQEMSQDDAADILRELPESFSSEILKLMESSRSEEVEELLQYQEDTAGGIMSPQFFALQEHLCVGESISKLQKESNQQEMVFYIYVVNDVEQLVGVISLRQLLMVPPDTLLKDIMTSDVIRVTTAEDQEVVAQLVSTYNILAVPVVDDSNKLVGIVTVDDVIDVIREEATEDFLKMATVGNADILELSSLKNFRARFPWLLASFFSGSMAFFIIRGFGSALSNIAVLSGFIPIVLGMGGNVGTQTSAVIVRGIATGKIAFHQLWKVLFKELSVGALLALSYGVILGLCAHFYASSYVHLGWIVGLSLFFVMIIASILGVFVPLIFERFHFDPALATGPFITTGIDVLSTLIFFNLTHLFFHVTS
ncbi:MAG: magnesium transporter [Deltaproteobacteria bacterium]|nr:magnesium transporter [Deltaproteobacteria bacterium]